jgi:hypothetical protein
VVGLEMDREVRVLLEQVVAQHRGKMEQTIVDQVVVGTKVMVDPV